MTSDFISDLKQIVRQARGRAYASINYAQVASNWLYIARYSILKGNEQLFATKYKLLLPTPEELQAEIENQRELFLMQKGL